MNRKLIMGILAVAVALLALVIGIGIYNAPTSRLSRHLELANKYLLEMEYEQAIVEFDKVITIDPMSVEAYLGKAEAYVGLDDYVRAVETLEAGYLAAQEDAAIKDRLAAVYKEILKMAASYEEQLEIYDRLMELDEADEEVLSGLEKCLEQYINILLEERKSDEIRALIEKYKDILAGTDFDTFILQIEMRLREMGYSSLLNEVQELILAENYEQLNVLVQEKEYQDMIASLQAGESYYLGERNAIGEREGIGIAVHKRYEGNEGTFFYYGSWSADEKSGQGQAFYPTPGNSVFLYRIFIGEWANDLPNGKGEERRYYTQDSLDELEEGSSCTSLIQGSYKDGLYDGEIYYENIDRDGPVFWQRGVAQNGVWVPKEVKPDGDIIYSEGERMDGAWRVDVSMSPEYNKDYGVTWLFPSTEAQ